MNRIELKAQSAPVHLYEWPAVGARPRLLMIGLHGGIQRGLHYDALARTLAEKGVQFYALDFRGHGQWLSNKEERPSVDYDETTRDLIRFTHQLRAQYPDLPIFCMGESLGASVAMSALSSEPKLFDGLVFASAGIKPAIGSQWKAILKSAVDGARTLGATINVEPHVRAISDDSRSNAEMIEDPQCRMESSLVDLIHTALFIHKSHRFASKVDSSIPILVLQGREDKIISPRSTEKLFNKFRSADKTYHAFEDTGHLLVTTRFLKPEVISVVQEWLGDKVAAHSDKGNKEKGLVAKMDVPAIDATD